MKSNSMNTREVKSALLQSLIDNRRIRTQPLRRQLSGNLFVEHRSLLSLFATGELEKVDAVAIGTLSDLLLLRAKEVVNRRSAMELDHDLPIFSCVRSMACGRIASFIVPRFYHEIYTDRPRIVDLVNRSLRMARLIGAGCVSLTGLLASATDYGAACEQSPDLPVVTTGHATTASAVVLATRDLLRMAGRDFSLESVGFVGLGSVGSTVLELMLKVLGHPRSIALCDIYKKRDSVDLLMKKVLAEHSYKGTLSFYQSREVIPDPLYDCTLLIGATNVPDVVEVKRLRPGTLLVDDSDPHCFNRGMAIQRLKQEGDILFTEGGTLHCPEPIEQLLYVPPDLSDIVPVTMALDSDRMITGCVLSALLSARYGYPATCGLVTSQHAFTHYSGLVQSGYSAAPPHIGTEKLDASLIDSFRARFGNLETS